VSGNGGSPPNPYTRAIAEGRCPMCQGTKIMPEGTVCLHDDPRHAPGQPCPLCHGTGRWQDEDDPP
jgi:hypothetical protein